MRIPVYLQTFGRPADIIQIGEAKDQRSWREVELQFEISPSRTVSCEIKKVSTKRGWLIIAVPEGERVDANQRAMQARQEFNRSQGVRA